MCRMLPRVNILMFSVLARGSIGTHKLYQGLYIALVSAGANMLPSKLITDAMLCFVFFFFFLARKKPPPTKKNTFFPCPGTERVSGI